MEVSKLKQEVAVLKSELNRAEEELEDRSWIAPPLLQTWLQLIYETEVQQVGLIPYIKRLTTVNFTF